MLMRSLIKIIDVFIMPLRLVFTAYGQCLCERWMVKAGGVVLLASDYAANCDQIVAVT